MKDSTCLINLSGKNPERYRAYDTQMLEKYIRSLEKEYGCEPAPACGAISSHPVYEQTAKSSDKILKFTPGKENRSKNQLDGVITNNGKKYRRVNIIINVIFYGVLGLAILSSILFAAASGTDRFVFGYKFYSVLSQSMNDTYLPGDLLLVKQVNTADIAVNDVIAYYAVGQDDTAVTHRVVEVIPDYNGWGGAAYKTKGDGNNEADPWTVTEDRVIGKVVGLFKNGGNVILFLKNNLWIVLGIPIFALLGVTVFRFSSRLRRRKQTIRVDDIKPVSGRNTVRRG